MSHVFRDLPGADTPRELAGAAKSTRKAQPHAQQKSIGSFFKTRPAGEAADADALFAAAAAPLQPPLAAASTGRVTLPPVAFSSLGSAAAAATAARKRPADKKNDPAPSKRKPSLGAAPGSGAHPSLLAFCKPQP